MPRGSVIRSRRVRRRIMPQIPAERMSHGLRVVAIGPARSGVPSHGATPRGRQLSARIISFFGESY